MLSAHISVNQLQITCTWTHTIKDEECSSMCMLALALSRLLSLISEKDTLLSKMSVLWVCQHSIGILHTYSSAVISISENSKSPELQDWSCSKFSFSQFWGSQIIHKNAEEICRDSNFDPASTCTEAAHAIQQIYSRTKVVGATFWCLHYFCLNKNPSPLQNRDYTPI